MSFTKRQQLFVNEYLQSFNATQSAKAAGYSGNDNTLAQRGHELVRNSKIAELISQRLSESAMSADEVLMRLAETARNDKKPTHQLRALELLAKHHGLLSDVLKIKVEDELNSALDLLEKSLDKETYNRVLAIFAQAGEAETGQV